MSSIGASCAKTSMEKPGSTHVSLIAMWPITSIQSGPAPYWGRPGGNGRNDLAPFPGTIATSLTLRSAYSAGLSTSVGDSTAPVSIGALPGDVETEGTPRAMIVRTRRFGTPRFAEDGAGRAAGAFTAREIAAACMILSDTRLESVVSGAGVLFHDVSLERGGDSHSWTADWPNLKTGAQANSQHW